MPAGHARPNRDTSRVDRVSFEKGTIDSFLFFISHPCGGEGRGAEVLPVLVRVVVVLLRILDLRRGHGFLLWGSVSLFRGCWHARGEGKRERQRERACVGGYGPVPKSVCVSFCRGDLASTTRGCVCGSALPRGARGRAPSSTSSPGLPLLALLYPRGSVLFSGLPCSCLPRPTAGPLARLGGDENN